MHAHSKVGVEFMKNLFRGLASKAFLDAMSDGFVLFVDKNIGEQTDDGPFVWVIAINGCLFDTRGLRDSFDGGFFVAMQGEHLLGGNNYFFHALLGSGLGG